MPIDKKQSCKDKVDSIRKIFDRPKTKEDALRELAEKDPQRAAEILKEMLQNLK